MEDNIIFLENNETCISFDRMMEFVFKNSVNISGPFLSYGYVISDKDCEIKKDDIADALDILKLIVEGTYSKLPEYVLDGKLPESCENYGLYLLKSPIIDGIHNENGQYVFDTEDNRKVFQKCYDKHIENGERIIAVVF